MVKITGMGVANTGRPSLTQHQWDLLGAGLVILLDYREVRIHLTRQLTTSSYVLKYTVNQYKLINKKGCTDTTFSVNTNTSLLASTDGNSRYC